MLSQSACLAGESSLKRSVNSQPRHWDEETVEKFIRALFVVGTGSNVKIAREMRSKKTAHNVKGYKLKLLKDHPNWFLKDHPNWNTEFRHLDPKGVLPNSEIAIEEEETPEVTEVVTVEIPAEREETVVIEAAVETEGFPEKEVVTTPVHSEPEATVETVEAEAVPGEETTVETETPVDGERAEETEVTVEMGDNEEVAVETVPTVPHAHGAGGETVPVITIAYPCRPPWIARTARHISREIS